MTGALTLAVVLTTVVIMAALAAAAFLPELAQVVQALEVLR